MIYARFLILAKVSIYSGCQMSASLTNIPSITASANKLIATLERFSLLYGSFVEKAHRSFSLGKTNLTFRLLQNHLQSWSIFFRISLECSPINGNLKYLILISDSAFSEVLSFLQFILSFKYDLIIQSMILRGYWFYLRILLRSLRSLSKPVEELLILYIRSTNVLIMPIL